jgi:hypothetical protein
VIDVLDDLGQVAERDHSEHVGRHQERVLARVVRWPESWNRLSVKDDHARTRTMSENRNHSRSCR